MSIQRFGFHFLRNIHVRTLAVAVFLAIVWYLAMLIPDRTGEILRAEEGRFLRFTGSVTANGIIFTFLTSVLLAIWLHLSRSIRIFGLRIFFALPWPLLGVIVFSLSLYFIADPSFAEISDLRFWLAVLFIAPAALIADAWVILLVMLPVTIALGEAHLKSVRKQQIEFLSPPDPQSRSVRDS